MRILALFLVLLAAVPLVLADNMEITISYNVTGCTESWSCTSWSACSSGSQTRTCSDYNMCNTTFYKPSETQSCSSGGQQGGGGGGGGGGGSSIVKSGTSSGNVTITEPKHVISVQPDMKESSFLILGIESVDAAEAGEPIIVNVTASANSPIFTTIEVLGKSQDIYLGANQSKTLTFEVYAPETGGDYNLFAVSPYATANKTIYLTYNDLFLYVNSLGNSSYEVNMKSFDNSSNAEIHIIKDNFQTVYWDSLKGRVDYKFNITLTDAGNYTVKARLMSGPNLLDENTRYISIGGTPEFSYGWLILIAVVVVILIGFIFILIEKRR